MVTLFKSNMYTCIYWLIENFLCSFLNYPLIEFLQSNMIQFVACTLQYCMYDNVFYRHPKKITIVYTMHIAIIVRENIAIFFVFIRII